MASFKNSNKNINIFHLSICAAFLFFFYGYFYSDILITTSHGINFWDVVFSGRIFDFHALCCSDVDNAAYNITTIYAGYDFPIYVLFGIWDFPLWLIRKLIGINIWESVPAMMWAKSIILVFIILALKSLNKICDTMNMADRKEIVSAIYLSSAFISSAAAVNSQCDIITSYFMLEAVNYYLKGSMKKFVIFIILAVFIKPFSFFLFVPLLLYAEKNIIKIGLYSLCALIPYLGVKIIIPNNTQLTTYSTVLTLFKNKVRVAMADIPVFLFVSFLFWMICYIYKAPDEKEKFDKNSAMIAYVSFAVFFMLCACNPYWCIMLMPFQCLVIGINRKNEIPNVILETVSSVCLIGHYVIELPWCFDVKILRTSFFARFFGMRADATDNLLDIIHNMSEGIYEMRDRISGMLFGIFFMANVVFMWLNLFEHKNIVFENERLPRYAVNIRFLISLGICLIPLAAYIF